MSIEIEENYGDPKGFYFLLSLSYDKFASQSERWKDKADLRTIFNRIKEMCKQVIRSKGRIVRIYNPSITSINHQGGRLFGPTSIQFGKRLINE